MRDYRPNRCSHQIRQMTEGELLAFGRQMHDLVYPLSYGGDGKPQVSAFSIQLDEAGQKGGEGEEAGSAGQLLKFRHKRFSQSLRGQANALHFRQNLL